MKLPYQEGSVFVLPLLNGGFARGVVARTTSRGRVLLGYFFGPRLEDAASANCDGLTPEGAVIRVRFGDLKLFQGEWQVIGSVPDWDRQRWPIPEFVRRELPGTRVWRVRYSDADPNLLEAETLISGDTTLDQDRMLGAGAVEKVLSTLV
jgi:hypothetical protein